MKYLKSFNESDESWKRRKDVILGKVEDWDKMSQYDRIAYLNPEYSRLEIEFEKMTHEYISKAALNWMLFVYIEFLVIDLKKIDKTLATEVMYRVTEMENPIRIVKDISNKFDLSKLTSIFKDRIIGLTELSDSINPFVDFVEELNS